MKFSDLFEMPTFINSELPVTDVTVGVLSSNTLKREYTLLGRVQQQSTTIMSAIKNNHKSAVIGRVVKRDDGLISLEVITTLTFHDIDDIPQVIRHLGPKALQVDTVVSTDAARGAGYGYTLYKMLLNYGITLLSDNIQYIGGKELWMKIVRRAGKDNHSVTVIQDGKFITDSSGNPIKYDGRNIPDSVIWSEDKRSEPHYYTLLVCSNN